jgi:beta-galactosidase
MQRREFIKKTGAAVVAGMLAENTFGQMSNSSPPSPSGGRVVLPMNRNWRYSRSFAEGRQAKDFDDSKFETVVVPHTNAKLPWHGFDEKTYEFVSIYRRHFKLRKEARGKHVFVDFEGVMTASTVWINGVRLGE